MTTTEHPPTDRTGWEAGPWDSEPDRIQWTDEATGYPCLINRGPVGALCGYVAVPPGHPLHGLDYGDVNERLDYPGHGELTYSGACSGSICHVPAPGEPDDVWWLGFDCAHHMDLCPGLDAQMRNIGIVRETRGTYRTVEYVHCVCERLAEQVSEAAA